MLLFCPNAPPHATPFEMRRALACTGAFVMLGLAAAPVVVVLRARQSAKSAAAALSGAETAPPLSHAEHVAPSEPPAPPPPATARPVAGLDLTRVTADGAQLVAPTGSGTAHLTLDPSLQQAASELMASYHLPGASAVLMDAATGRLLVYASHVENGAPEDLCAEAVAPSASVFKVVTAAALIEEAHLGPDTKQCYSGGESRISALDLEDDARRDRRCTTLGGALGHSINTVFARLASRNLTPAQLETMARRFGYGQAPVFDVPVQPSQVHVPDGQLELARTAAGFWNTTLSPLEAAQISAIVARGGATVQPVLVDEVTSPTGAVVWRAPDASPPQRAIARETAEALTEMMQNTVTEGTSFHAFHDLHGGSFLRDVPVAGKTGTLADADAHRYYTWFTGFAPARPEADVRQVAVAVLVVNGPSWRVKANVIARDLLRAYFANRGVAGVTQPSVNRLQSTVRSRKKYPALRRADG
jgi:cell division protein FtsI/penicillin-binding protein 2